MALTHDIRLALAARVQRRVEGRGIPRHVIDDAVSRVGEALDRLSPASETRVLRESIVDYALQMLLVRLPGNKAQLRFEKVLPTSRYYVIPSEVEESQILIRKHSRPGLR